MLKERDLKNKARTQPCLSCMHYFARQLFAPCIFPTAAFELTFGNPFQDSGVEEQDPPLSTGRGALEYEEPLEVRSRAKMEQLGNFKGLLPASQGQNLVLTDLHSSVEEQDAPPSAGRSALEYEEPLEVHFLPKMVQPNKDESTLT